MSKNSLGKQPAPGSRDRDGHPSGFAAGPAINALRAATATRFPNIRLIQTHYETQIIALTYQIGTGFF